VGKSDFLIRRIVREILGKPVEEIRREIRINIDLPQRGLDRRPR
jgi:hypothetical protein